MPMCAKNNLTFEHNLICLLSQGVELYDLYGSFQIKSFYVSVTCRELLTKEDFDILVRFWHLIEDVPHHYEQDQCSNK